jgi:hypothetical protein
MLAGRIALGLIVVLAGLAPTAAGSAPDGCPEEARVAAAPAWPPPPEEGAIDVVHFGEAHWNEGQGPLTMPILIQDVLSYDPSFVTFSADIADIGTLDRLACFTQIIRPATAARIPWFNSPGNHDRVAVAGPGGVANGAIDIWREVFAPMPQPWGDGPVPGARFVVPQNEPDDGEGAATHYYFDYGPVGEPFLRVIALDNSQQSLTTSDQDQYPAVGPGQTDASQLAFLERVATEAQEKGLMTWVVMHQPTQDPRDISNVNPASYNHTMGKGASGDNAAFDAIAQVTGVDAVFLGHIQGNVVYGVGDTDYYIDGGGGGSPYALHEVGTDTGYYYGFRVMRLYRGADGWTARTYFVPLVDRIEIEGPEGPAKVGDEIALTATATQPYDPDLPPRLGLAPNEAIKLELRPPEMTPADRDSVPLLAYMWKTSNPRVLKPVPAEGAIDDPSFNERTMTTSGRFEAVGRGIARITIMTGTHRETIRVQVR